MKDVAWSTLSIAMDWSLYGFEVRRIYFDTSESDRPVLPSSVQAKKNIRSQISAGQRSIVAELGRISMLHAVVQLMVGKHTSKHVRATPANFGLKMVNVFLICF